MFTYYVLLFYKIILIPLKIFINLIHKLINIDRNIINRTFVKTLKAYNTLIQRTTYNNM